MKLLIVGYGSIGSRHARLAVEAGIDVGCVTRNVSCPFKSFDSVAVAIAAWKPDRVIVSNATAQHLDTLRELDSAGYTGLTLVEKPLLDQLTDYVPSHPERIFVAYNMRFHPLAGILRDELSSRKLYAAEFHVGQYLPDWRPGTDYRKSYSASKQQGGGVLRDLSHELDLALWLCGDVRYLSAIGGHFSDLEIDSDDVFMVLAHMERCPSVVITMNYLNRLPQRIIRINAYGLTATVDFIAGTIDINGVRSIKEIDRDQMYREQLRLFIAGDRSMLCSFGEGTRIAQMIALCEQSCHNVQSRFNAC
jgi:predicted dehydrogenase